MRMDQQRAQPWGDGATPALPGAECDARKRGRLGLWPERPGRPPGPTGGTQPQAAGAGKSPFGRDLPTDRTVGFGMIYGVRPAVVAVFQCLHAVAFRRKVQGRGWATPM